MATSEQIIDWKSFRAEILALRKGMVFLDFRNEKTYSFDYNFQEAFDEIIKRVKAKIATLDEAVDISPIVTNVLPVFLPREVRRIAFFKYTSKSVRPIDTNMLPDILTRQARKRCRNGEFPYSEIAQRVRDDLERFKEHQTQNKADAYRRDILSPTIQFNAFDADDTVLIQNGFVRGGLVFDMEPDRFEEEIEITYPRRRKRRSDYKDEYLPLQLIDIRGIMLPPEKT